VICLLPALAHAERAATRRLLGQAADQVDGGDFEGALATLQDALSSPDNANAEIVDIRWRMGEVYVFMRREEPAREMFERLLYLDPSFEPPSLAGTRVRKVFEDARRAASERRLTVDLRAPSEPRPGAPVIRAGLPGMRTGFRALVYFREAMSEAWQSAEMRPEGEGVWAAQLPVFPGGSVVEYYVEVQGADRRRVQGVGSALEPRSLRLAAPAPAGSVRPGPETPAPKAWYKQPLVWGVVGGVAAVTGIVLWVALSPRPATLGLTVEFPAP